MIPLIRYSKTFSWLKYLIKSFDIDWYACCVREAPAGSGCCSNKILAWGRGGGGGENPFWKQYGNSIAMWLRNLTFIILHHFLPWYPSQYHLRIMCDHCRCQNISISIVKIAVFKKWLNFGEKSPTNGPFVWGGEGVETLFDRIPFEQHLLLTLTGASLIALPEHWTSANSWEYMPFIHYQARTEA